MNKDLLTRAVEKTIRPYLIEERKLYDTNVEAFHHKIVIPKARQHLTEEAIRSDPQMHVAEAIKISKILLSQYEHIHPVQFLKECDSTEASKHLLKLLYGKGELTKRVEDFLAWGGYRRIDDGTTIGFNGTIVGYLLAMVEPKRYAFCKPSIYKAAARALLYCFSWNRTMSDSNRSNTTPYRSFQCCKAKSRSSQCEQISHGSDSQWNMFVLWNQLKQNTEYQKNH